MTAVDEVAGITVAFDNGESHTYNLASQRKLRPMLDDAHQLTSETLFRLVDTDSSGSLDLKECAPPPPPQPHCATRPARPFLSLVRPRRPLRACRFAYLHRMIIQAERKHAETVLAAERDADEQRRNARKLCIALLAAIIIILILFGGVGGLVTAVVSAFKDTAAVGATLASNDGHVMKTSKALTPVPLLAAPVLPQEQLEGSTRSPSRTSTPPSRRRCGATCRSPPPSTSRRRA